MANNEENILLEMSDICKSFPGVKALDNACLTVKKGTVHALMGENGAGKSTLMKCLFGIYKKDSGSIKIEGESGIESGFEARRYGQYLAGKIPYEIRTDFSAQNV